MVARRHIAILAFAYSFWMIYGAGQEYIAQGFLLLMAGIPVYVYIKWRNAMRTPPRPVRHAPHRATEPTAAARDGGRMTA